MPYPVHNKFVVRGIFDGTPEIFSYGMHFNSVVAGGPDNLPQDWDEGAVTAAVNAFAGSAIFAAQAKVTGWRGYQIGADGRTIENNLKVVEYDTPVGGAGSLKYPPQIAAVVTLVADNRGPARFGRSYLPSPSAVLSSTDSRIASTAADSILSAFKTFVEALKNAMYDPVYTNESLVNVSRSGSGVMQNVTEYRCGRVLDTMRSRRNKMVEDYQSLSA